MKIERSKDWWLARAMREGNHTAAAGVLARDPVDSAEVDSASAHSLASVDETRIAFGRFVNLIRREHGLTIEKLAEKADLAIAELVNIEENLEYTPEPRTIFKLAETFEVSQLSLMQLSGLAVANDTEFREEAVRFAARSEPMQKLSKEERSALRAFVSVLSQGRGPKQVR